MVNTSKFLHTRAEFTVEGTGEKHYGWVSNIRNMELSLALTQRSRFELGDKCLVRLASETAVAQFESEILISDLHTVAFRVPVPFTVLPGDNQARVQVRGQYASISIDELSFIVELEDISLGGMAFVVPVSCEPHTFLRAQIPGVEDGSLITCDVRYCKRLSEEPDLFRVGVQFMSLSVAQDRVVRKIMLSPISRVA